MRHKVTLTLLGIIYPREDDAPEYHGYIATDAGYMFKPSLSLAISCTK